MKNCRALSACLLLGIAAASPTYGQTANCKLEDVLQPGDANKDLVFDALDIDQVERANKYRTRRPATWAEGDWNGDGLFDERDLIAALRTGNYDRGPYAVLAAGPPPSPRGGAPAVWLPGNAFLPTARCLLLFGGMDPITNDTFVFSSKDGWRELTNATAPTARCHHSLVNDGANGAIMFGGFSRARRFNDTLRFDPITSQWTELATTGAIPEPRCLHAAAWIPSTNQMLVYGGIQGSGNFGDDFFLDTSILDLNTYIWTRVHDNSLPGPLRGAIAFYSSSQDAVFLWGGQQMRGTIRNLDDHFVGYPRELWRYDPHQRTWEAVPVAGEIPEGREDPTYFWDDANSLLFIFHGYNRFVPTRFLDDAHVLNVREQRWERLATNGATPPTRWRASVVYDPQTRTGWMFGGWADFGLTALNDTWRFATESGSWLKVCVTSAAN